MTHKNVEKSLLGLASPQRAKSSQWFFKTGPGEYGEGDRFIGVVVPHQRKISRNFRALPLTEVQILLDSPVHEHRLTALFIMCLQFDKGDEEKKSEIYDMYLSNLMKGNVNNWDLVDSSAHKILGQFLINKDSSILYELAHSGELWQQRASVMATAAFIANDDYGDVLALSDVLITHEHDLIHKVVGWMLREVGKRDRAVEEEFLKTRYKKMPRTMLRYAIEKFPETLRKKYLEGSI